MGICYSVHSKTQVSSSTSFARRLICMAWSAPCRLPAVLVLPLRRPFLWLSEHLSVYLRTFLWLSEHLSGYLRTSLYSCQMTSQTGITSRTWYPYGPFLCPCLSKSVLYDSLWIIVCHIGLLPVVISKSISMMQIICQVDNPGSAFK